MFGYTITRGDGTGTAYLKYQDIASDVRPHRNLRQIRVYPKDKVEDKRKTDCVYQNPM